MKRNSVIDPQGPFGPVAVGFHGQVARVVRVVGFGSVNAFKVPQLNHVELMVPNRQEAALWYHRVLGLEILPEYELWAADPRGPLMISSDGGNTKLALFEGRSQSPTPTSGFRLVAFRVGASGFVEFLERLRDLQLRDHRGQFVTFDSVVDHEKAYSFYFSDPYGHRLELTTYDYEASRAALMALREHAH